MKKMRLDVYLTENNFVQSREKAKAVIMSGIVYINNDKADKVGTIVKDGDSVEVRGKGQKYVSRGGAKLEKALEEFDISLTNAIAMDIGASTGGFTDCMLQNGVKKVYSVDVGYGQLAWKLRNDERVVNMERTNIRSIDTECIELLDFISIDVAFISLKLVLPIANRILSNDGSVVALIKPQFEAGREKVGKNGVVRDPVVHEEVIEEIVQFSRQMECKVCGITFSPIKGPAGNIEYLIWLKKIGVEQADLNISEIVSKAHGGGAI